MIAYKFLLWLLGVRVVESPEVIRVTTSKRARRFMPELLENTRQRLEKNRDTISSEIKGNSLIVRLK